MTKQEAAEAAWEKWGPGLRLWGPPGANPTAEKQMMHVAFLKGRDSLAPLVQQLAMVVQRWTNLSDMDAERYTERYDCKSYACAVDCFVSDARTALAAAAEQGFVPEGGS